MPLSTSSLRLDSLVDALNASFISILESLAFLAFCFTGPEEPNPGGILLGCFLLPRWGSQALMETTRDAAEWVQPQHRSHLRFSSTGPSSVLGQHMLHLHPGLSSTFTSLFKVQLLQTHIADTLFSANTTLFKKFYIIFKGYTPFTVITKYCLFPMFYNTSLRLSYTQ